jgi:hypothetical protein
MLCVVVYPTRVVMSDRSGGQHVRQFFNRFHRHELYCFYSKFGFREYRENEDGMIMLANFLKFNINLYN